MKAQEIFCPQSEDNLSQTRRGQNPPYVIGGCPPAAGEKQTQNENQNSNLTRPEDLRASMVRLEETNSSVAVWRDGHAELYRHPVDVAQAWKKRATVWTPAEMLDYVSLSPDGRALMRELKGLTQQAKGKV